MATVSRALEILRAEGILGFPRRGALRVLRSVARGTDRWTRELERHLGGSSREELAVLASNGALRDRHRGRRCFVIGNGPSLAAQDLSPLAGEVTLVTNAFHKHPILERWQPTYYLLADSLYFDGSEPMRVFFADIRSRVHATTFMVPAFGRDRVASMGLLPLAQTHFVAFKGILPDGLGNGPDFTRAVPAVQSVSQLAIMAAMYMGCSPIYLMGMDHDWLAQRGMDRHFYAGHPIPGHAKAHGDLDQCSYAADLEAALKLWRGYEQIQATAAARGVEILNATGGGFLDVFPRVSYESLT